MRRGYRKSPGTIHATHQFAVMPASRMTRPHFSYSDLMCAPNASGVLVHTSSPCLNSTSTESGRCRICTISLLSRATMLCGVFAVTTKPYQLCDSYLGTPASAIVGSWGNIFERRAVVTASARTLPALTWGTEVGD